MDRIIVCGGRDYQDRAHVAAILEKYTKRRDMIMTGAAPGADRLAEEWAFANGRGVRRFPAQWQDLSHPSAMIRTRADGTRYDALAGLRRNELMLSEKPSFVIAFPGGSGTAHMVKIAKKAGVKVIKCGQSSTTALPSTSTSSSMKSNE